MAHLLGHLPAAHSSVPKDALDAPTSTANAMKSRKAIELDKIWRTNLIIVTQIGKHEFLALEEL